MREGITAAGQGRQPRATWLPPEIEAMDRLVSAMPPELRQALLLDQDRSLRMREIAAALQCTPHQARRAIDNAYGFVAGVLSERMRQ
jgi:DNA-directed RNA polymerase specialized sigma24 family protein